MAKRETPIETVDPEVVDTADPTAGQRLRAAREKVGLSLDDIAAQTRIPRRHLESIENADWDALPAPTYTTGFAKNYASAVGLDRTEIGDQLRAEMGGQRFVASPMEAFEPADPRRTMPKWLVLGAIGAVILLVIGMSWLNQRSLEPDPTNTVAAAEPAGPSAAAPATQQPAPTPAGVVVLSATAPVWLQVSEKGGATLFSGMLQTGQTYAVPATASAPLLKTGKPEALRISVGNQIAPPVGRAATRVSNVSLVPADLMRQGQAVAAQPNATQAATSAPAETRATRRAAPRLRTPAPAPTPAPEPAPVNSAAPATTNTGQ